MISEGIAMSKINVEWIIINILRGEDISKPIQYKPGGVWTKHTMGVRKWVTQHCKDQEREGHPATGNSRRPKKQGDSRI